MQENAEFENEDSNNLCGGGFFHAVSYMDRFDVTAILFRIFVGAALILALGTMSGMRASIMTMGVYLSHK